MVENIINCQNHGLTGLRNFNNTFSYSENPKFGIPNQVPPGEFNFVNPDSDKLFNQVISLLLSQTAGIFIIITK